MYKEQALTSLSLSLLRILIVFFKPFMFITFQKYYCELTTILNLIRTHLFLVKQTSSIITSLNMHTKMKYNYATYEYYFHHSLIIMGKA
jgi:hypothetical protein